MTNDVENIFGRRLNQARLIKGLTMGSIEATKKIDDYKDKIDKDILKLLKELQNFQEDAINKLKKYL